MTQPTKRLKTTKLVAGAIAVAALAAGLVGCSGEDLETPEGVAAAYLKAMEDRDMEKVLDLTSGDALGGLDGIETVSEVKHGLTDVKIGEQTWDDEGDGSFAIVAVSYSVDGKKYRGALRLTGVTQNGKQSYRVQNEPPTLDYGNDFTDVKIDGQAGPAVVPLGAHEVHLAFDNPYLAETECKETVILSLDGQGEVAEEASGEGCLELEMFEREISETAADEAVTAVNSLAGDCGKGCDSETLESVGGDALQTLPEGCDDWKALKWLGTGEGFEDYLFLGAGSGGDYECFGNSMTREPIQGTADRVHLMRIPSADAVEGLTVTPASNKLRISFAGYETCHLLCGDESNWEKAESELNLYYSKDGFTLVPPEEGSWDDTVEE